jgi:hypothetical protein
MLSISPRYVKAIVDGESKEMDIAPVVINTRTRTPVRFAAEKVGCVVDWISSTLEIVIVFYTGEPVDSEILTRVLPDVPDLNKDGEPGNQNEDGESGNQILSKIDSLGGELPLQAPDSSVIASLELSGMFRQASLRANDEILTKIDKLSAKEVLKENEWPLAEGIVTVPVESGIELNWDAVPGAIGYRVYRSTVKGVEGISITDFPITTTTFTDVNVDPEAVYYYKLRTLKKEYNAATYESETLEPPLPAVTPPSGGQDGQPNVTIIAKIDNLVVSVNGNNTFADPERPFLATTVLNARTMMMPCGFVETMDGQIRWDNDEQKITLKANGHTVEMWMGKKDFVVDGSKKYMDVAPTIIDGGRYAYVPMRYALEGLGCTVNWVLSTSEIVILYKGVYSLY